jgi:hypothetical protein
MAFITPGGLVTDSGNPSLGEFYILSGVIVCAGHRKSPCGKSTDKIFNRSFEFEAGFVCSNETGSFYVGPSGKIEPVSDSPIVDMCSDGGEALCLILEHHDYVVSLLRNDLTMRELGRVSGHEGFIHELALDHDARIAAYGVHHRAVGDQFDGWRTVALVEEPGESYIKRLDDRAPEYFRSGAGAAVVQYGRELFLMDGEGGSTRIADDCMGVLASAITREGLVFVTYVCEFERDGARFEIHDFSGRTIYKSECLNGSSAFIRYNADTWIASCTGEAYVITRVKDK